MIMQYVEKDELTVLDFIYSYILNFTASLYSDHLTNEHHRHDIYKDVGRSNLKIAPWMN